MEEHLVSAHHYSELPSEIRINCDEGVLEVTLSRPERLNAINARMHEGLVRLFELIDSDTECRSVLLRGEGPTFSAGGDYDWFRELVSDDAVRIESFRQGKRLLDEMVRCKLPLVSAIRGGAVGLGASISLLSDIVVMSADGFLRDPHVVIGLVAGDGGAAVWPSSVSLQIAKEYLLLGDRLPASLALQLGLVNRVVPSDQVDATARGLARRLAALPHQAVSATKRAINLHLQRDMNGIAEYALMAELMCHRSPDFVALTADMGRRSSNE